MQEKDANYDHLRIMFLAERTAVSYSSPIAWKSLSQQVWKHGGIPYLVTFRRLNLPLCFKSQEEERMIYSIPRSEGLMD